MQIYNLDRHKHPK